ncbi:MAG: serine/threonine-protein kinase [Anaerolineales bacterium]
MIKVLNGYYQIVSLIDQGGFGSVYKALDTRTGQIKAVKASIDNSAAYQEQFSREANILRTVIHPNLPRVTDFFFEEQVHYLVMDFVEGNTLKNIVGSSGPLPYSIAYYWLNQIASALTLLHSKTPPILHRDVKPSNIIITPDDKAVLVDFGLAKLHENQKTVTAAKAVTPGYSPPEQYGQGTTDLRSDVYAFAATFFFCLVGNAPQEFVERIDEDSITHSIRSQSRIPVIVQDAIIKGMSLSPRDRFCSITDFVNAIPTPSATIKQRKPLGELERPPLREANPENNPNTSITVDRIHWVSPIVSELMQENGKNYLTLSWKGVLVHGLAYHIVRKRRSRPRNPHDGVSWITYENTFQDHTLPNGEPVFYAIYAYNGKVFSSSCLYSQEIIRTDDVKDLNAIRDRNNVITLRWKSPALADWFLVRKSIYSPPSNIMDGEEVCTIEHDGAENTIEAIDRDWFGKTKTFYTVFCRYRKSRRDTIVSSKGVSITA